MKLIGIPSFKIEVSSQTFINDQALTINLKRPENNISYIGLTVQDYKSANYIDVFDAFDQIDISLRYDSDAWRKVFTGNISTVAPKLSVEGEVLEVGAWGQGVATVKTHCDESYGVESIDNSAVDTPKEIIEDIINEHVEKEFGGAASNWTINSKVEDAHNGLSITYLNSQYLNNFVNINRVCDLTTAYAQGLGAPEVGVHWFVDPSANLYFKKIDADHSDGNWDRYYGGSQANATIEVAEDMILYGFKKNVEEYANRIILSSQFRKPSEDYWTEDNGGQVLWADDGNCSRTDSATSIVGSHSLLIEPTGGVATNCWYPIGKAAGWDLTKCGSQNTIPTLNMYVRVNKLTSPIGTALRLYTGPGAADYFGLYTVLDTFVSAADEFCFVSLPVGPYFNVNQDPLSKSRWVGGGGAEDWANINYIRLGLPGDNTYDVYIDDLHFAGVVVREASDAAEIAANNAYQKVIRNDTAVNDTLKQSDDSGTAARLAYAELLRRSQTPIVGMVQLPMLVDLLPGQTLHVHACKQSDGGFRIDQDFRVKDVRHIIAAPPFGFRTNVNLTSDVTNTHAFGVPSQHSLLKQFAGALAHSEARNLKGGALDNLIPRLAVAY